MTGFDPVALSLGVATGSTILTLVVGLPLARAMASRSSILSRIAEGLIMLPMVLPPTVTGYILLSLFGRHGPFGSALDALGIHIVFTRTAAVIASATVSLPLMYQSCKSAILSVDPLFARAAGTLGAGPARIFFRVELPLALPGIIGGMALAFARGFGEFGATLMLAGNIPGLTQTLPLAIYGAVESGDEPRARFLLGATVVIAFAIVIVVSVAEGRSRRQGGKGRNRA
jgi:molybdate transport system permease protein